MLRPTLQVAAACWLSLAPAALAQSADPVDPQDLAAFQQALPPTPTGTMNPDLSLVLGGALAGFSEPQPLQPGGHDPQQNGFNLQFLELSAGASVDPFWRFDAHMVFGPDGFELEEAYGTTLALPLGLQARAGQFLTRFGRLNPTHPHAWDFADQPLVLAKFLGGDGNRALGAELSWLAPLPWYSELVVSSTQAAGEATARSFYGATDQGVRGPQDLQLTGALKQFFPLGADLSLAWGLSGATGPHGEGRRAALYGTDLYLKLRPASWGVGYLALTAEGLARQRSEVTGTLLDTGGYLSLVGRWDQNWGGGLRYERVGGVPGDPLDPDGVGDRARTSAELTWWASEFSQLRLQVRQDAAPWRDPGYALFLGYEFAAGAHAAHPF